MPALDMDELGIFRIKSHNAFVDDIVLADETRDKVISKKKGEVKIWDPKYLELAK